MSLKISLELNNLTERPDDYMAVVRNVVYKDFSGILKQLTGPGSILKETECVAVINAFWGAIGENLKEGIGYSSEFVNITPAAGGVFDSDSESFNENKHWKDVNLTAGTELRKATRDMKIEIVHATAPVPYVKSFFDISTERANQSITPGFMADITGDMLKIEGDNSGVFFINTATNTGTASPRVHVNEPKKLTVMIPADLDQGSYKIEVRTHVRNSKELRTGVLNAILTVG